MENVVARITLFHSLLPLKRNGPIDLLCKSVDWFLYNDKTGLD